MSERLKLKQSFDFHVRDGDRVSAQIDEWLLWCDTLRDIRDGVGGNPKALAEHALQTLDADLRRRYE